MIEVSDCLLWGYVGNKFKETKEHIKKLNLNEESLKDIKTIIEPYAGSFGFSRYMMQI
jgi:site-specific DNA-adenine methylase